MVKLGQDRFGELHPAVNLVWFVAAFCYAMTLMHPVLLAISLACAAAYSISGGRGSPRPLVLSLAMMALTAALNPLLSHEGATILRYLPSGNPLTYESICFGAAAGGRLAATLLLFFAMTRVFTADKTVFLAGRVLPALGILMAMTLGFVPRFRRKAEEIRLARRAMTGMEARSWRQRIAEALRVFSALVTWCLEGTAETADSLRCRGYGLRRRTAYRLWRFGRRDAVILGTILFLAVYVLAGVTRGAAAFSYYPTIQAAGWDWYSLSVAAAYAALCAVPTLINLWEELRWRSLTSKT